MNEQTLSQRLEKLESQVAFQEDTIDQLNKLIAEQNQELALFKRHLKLLAQRIDQAPDHSDEQVVDEPPPHY
ncbi:hypothetical protein CWE09_13040 [Aliidiomarina minuta]|uniref:Protein SlyX homolog n=1 Tax=Aliidiomarina minuta TaxID=880057 RepID=A0A432W3X5_9GAMM|nr:SlyX family protein [Aliidiomarina minuta]RUO24063.1 hypothetical protein CWE09_13040 [Aliidiomarina minuta]